MSHETLEQVRSEWRTALEKLDEAKKKMLSSQSGPIFDTASMKNFLEFGREFDACSDECSRLAAKIASFNQ